jgi:hypothetical protein
MKIKKIILQNIGLLQNETIELNQPLTLIFGDIRQGKTTVLNAARWLFGATVPNDIIQHGKVNAKIELITDNGFIYREWYINKNGEITSKPIQAIIDNKKLSQKELTAMVNPFQLDQDYFRRKNLVDKKRYLFDLFEIDTKEIDERIAKGIEFRTKLKTEIAAFGDIAIIEVQKPCIDELVAKRSVIETDNQQKLQEIKDRNEVLRINYETAKEIELDEIETFNIVQRNILAEKKDAQKLLTDILNFIEFSIYSECFNKEMAEKMANELPEPLPLKPLKNTILLPNYEVEIVDNTAINEVNELITAEKIKEVEYNNYLKLLERQKCKDSKQLTLVEAEKKINDLRNQKLAKLAEYSGKVKGLNFMDNGDFTFFDTSSEMLSDSQLIELSTMLSAFYPHVLGIELIDRGESLGKSVYDLCDYAKKHERNVLVTIVGDKPADVKEDIGVYVIQDGKINR